MRLEKLCDALANALEYTPLEIPSYIISNVNRELRKYQIEALQHFLLQRKKPKTNHLMFNMATGSGKTLVMAALILECYANGYRDFIFFVNSTTILEKTKSNFTSMHSSKYLFKEQIFIDSKPISINLINNLEESREDSINIHFTTIQMLFSLLTMERENSPTLSDFKDRKIVFLADEAHHLNSYTKNKGKQSNEDRELKEGWEAIINKAFESNEKNLMLEFSATIPRELAILEKYRSKIVYEYDLKKFCLDGYSKRIFVLKYASNEIKDRLLGGILMSLFRELLALENNLFIKPVVLFKSESIASSLANEKIFLEFLENLDSNDIDRFYSYINKNEGELFYKSFEFFKSRFGESYSYMVKERLKANFKKSFILNTNSNEDASKNQLLLNSLEEKDNEIRVIFCVDKLNEGWDVLNLFDIVRLGNLKNSKTTTKEVQLIGRGARYYPFDVASMHSKYKRKFDCSAQNPLSILEYLGYHTINDAKFIKDLNKSMCEEGLLTNEEYEKIDLIPTSHALKITKENKIYYARNNRYKKGDLESYFIDSNEMKKEIIKLNIPLYSRGIEEIEEDFSGYKEETKSKMINKIKKIPTLYFLKALNLENIGFDELRKHHKCKSKRDFIENYLGEIHIRFASNQNFNDTSNCLSLARYIVSNIKNIREKIKQEYEVDSFKIQRFEVYDRVVFAKKNKFKTLNYEWLFYDRCLFNSKLEEEFLDFIEENKNRIDEYFCNWFVIRNEGFEEFKIYDNRKNEATYAKGFEPDFIFFGKKKESEYSIGVECFIEVKGMHLSGLDEVRGIDKWKEEFLESIKGEKFLLNKNDFLKIESLPFFISINDSRFIESFLKFLEA